MSDKPKFTAIAFQWIAYLTLIGLIVWSVYLARQPVTLPV